MATKKNEKRQVFSASMKMADLIDINYGLLGVLSRLGIPIGFGEDTVEETCRKHGINANTMLLICNVYSLDDYLPSHDLLRKTDLKDIVRYLHQSHSYYMDVALADLASQIGKMLERCDKKYQKIIWKFFSDYKEELSKHFEYEEKCVFPYVNSVLDHKESDGFTILQYEENHSNIEEKLEDLRNIIMKYLPVEADNQVAYNVLIYLYNLEADLRKHTSIEDDILVPVVNRLEEDGKQE